MKTFKIKLPAYASAVTTASGATTTEVVLRASKVQVSQAGVLELWQGGRLDHQVTAAFAPGHWISCVEAGNA